ncbi:hypothetical protein [Streptomyces sp. NPDC015125]|uniref:hypothetical protein n=1 Tax=Streptomyces sp. NPDC015125 TaxID=3364938 RepID=UPI003701D13B
MSMAVPELVCTPSGNSGQVLLLLADSDDEAVPAVKDQLSALIAEHEGDEWLDGEPCGRLRFG